MFIKKWIILPLLLVIGIANAVAQPLQKNLVYVDQQGILRWTKNKKEASFFGVNYTVPFAYGYRSHKALGIDLKKAIDADVYHMWRLGLDAFRVHIWDVDITDSSGNLLQNEHLDLFDYLLAQLKKRNIKILITPIAFWGNGYPERDIKTNGFSYVYGKGPSVVKEEAFKAQENYLKQIFIHINPYTKHSYKDDPDVIAMEINNEPHHSGPKERATEYVNRMAAAVKSTGWSKPIFYNISESPAYADAVVKAKVNGHSFQWYPTGLVAGHEQKGNYLPHVDQYKIPFGDTIPQFNKRTKVIYEFDAGDVAQPIMYPAMARSFRTAGFQWATQFAYDPLYTAYGNTEYQTHYLNLIYTPSKAISLLIASKVFHQVPLYKSYGTYPADTLFDVFRVSYMEKLSEMNSDEEFYYSNTTFTQPKNISTLKHIAGVGSSPVVKYEGTGAYFLDKIADGVWRLEVMPDVVEVKDPFEKASPKKEVTKTESPQNNINLNLPDLKNELVIKGVSAENISDTKVSDAGIRVQPGVYLIQRVDVDIKSKLQVDYFAPPSSVTEPVVVHHPSIEVLSGKSFTILSTIAGIDTSDNVSVEMRNSSNKWKTVRMQHVTLSNYSVEVPGELVTPGVINYRIIIQKTNNEYFVFPGGWKGDPYAWDEYRNESWQTLVAAPGSPLELFNPTTDRKNIILYNPDWRNNTIEYITAAKFNSLVLKATMNKSSGSQFMGWQYFFGDKISGRKDELSSFSQLVIKARSLPATDVKISLITANADAFSSTITLGKDWKEIEIPLASLRKDAYLLLPRPYPGFLPLRFTSAGNNPFNIFEIEKLEITFGEGAASSPVSIEVESVFLKK